MGAGHGVDGIELDEPQFVDDLMQRVAMCRTRRLFCKAMFVQK